MNIGDAKKSRTSQVQQVKTQNLPLGRGRNRERGIFRNYPLNAMNGCAKVCCHNFEPIKTALKEN